LRLAANFSAVSRTIIFLRDVVNRGFVRLRVAQDRGDVLGNPSPPPEIPS
jgi:hypothetical protein